MVNMTTSKETNNEVARLREEIDRLKRGCQGSCYACEPVGEMNLKLEAEVARFCRLLENMTESRDTMIEDRNVLDNEVARLRELLNRAIEIARTLRKLAFINSEDYCDWHFEDRLKAANDFADLCKEVNQLAPASEETQDGATMDEWYGGFSKIESTEPANPTCANITHKFSHCDCKQPSEKDTSTETCPSQKDTEWRELGPDEVIQEGDQVQPKHHDRKGAWIWIWSHEIGATPRDQEAMRYRTLRPLPTTNCKQIGSKLVDEPRQKGTVTEKDTKVSVNEPAPEWRELGEDEVIQEGDEFQEKQYDPIKNKWYTIYECSMVGKKVLDSDWGRFRTRRPLPKPTLSRDSYDEDWNLKPKQEEMPLEDEIETLWEHSEHIDSLTGHMAFKALAKSIRYLRDEIQKLKTQTHYHHESYCRKCKEPK